MNNPTLLYYYAHVYLPMVVFQHTQDFLLRVQRGPDVFKETLKKTFIEIKNDTNNNLNEKDLELIDDDLKPSITKLDNGLALLVINFPAPRHTAEVFFVGITLEPQPKYFTLELHRPVEFTESGMEDHAPDKYYLCIWASGKHFLLNKDVVTEPKAELFVAAVNKYLSPIREL